MVVYGQIDEVKELSGNVPDDEVDETQYHNAISKADDLINERTGRTWTTNDPGFKTVQAMSNYFAASQILDHFRDPEKKSEWLWKKFTDMMDMFLESSSLSTPGSTKGQLLKTTGPETA